MKISLNWLKEYIHLPEAPEEVAELLTQSGLEVSGRSIFEPIKGGLKGLIVGQVLTCEPHPNADRLKITRVEVGQDNPLQIVCGAPNVQVGQKIVVAPVGTTLYGQDDATLKIKKTKIRGELSEGMLCAEDEIGIGTGHEGIMVLDTSLSPGTPITQHFDNQQDEILEIDLTPNRGDACSHLGVARELGALLDRAVDYPSTAKFKPATERLPIRVEVLDSTACPRYAGITIGGVKVAPSPPWLSDKLRAIGLNPVNNIVDITNFVMHGFGQPLHAFDYDQLKGRQVTVKQLKPGTPFVTLDGTTRKLSGAELMICDQEGGISMAGVLGGQHTSVRAETQNIFLESAYFSPAVIRKAAKHHGLKTDASFRYERGIDPSLTVYALKWACSLIQEIAQGEITSELIDLYPEKIEACQIKVTYANIKRLLGQDISRVAIQQIFNRLDIQISQEEGESFVASIPPYRVDVRREVDIIEEIVRIYGYDRITIKEQLGSTYLARNSKQAPHQLKYQIASLLAAQGYYELYTNSLTKSSYAELTEALKPEQRVTISNPLSESLDVLRQTLIFGGLEVIARNINRKQSDLKLFEFGKTYHKTGEGHVEEDRLGIWLTGSLEAINWMKKQQAATFHDLHAVVHKVLQKLGVDDFKTAPFESPFYQTGVQIVAGQTPLLTAGTANPSLLKHMNIDQPVFFADIAWDSLLNSRKSLNQYQEMSKFPPVKRDISLVLDKSISFEEVKKVIEQQANKLIQDFTVFDVYEGEKLAPNKKAYALSFVLQGKDKTLDDKTIDQVMGRLMRAFEAQLGALIRT